MVNCHVSCDLKPGSPWFNPWLCNFCTWLKMVRMVGMSGMSEIWSDLVRSTQNVWLRVKYWLKPISYTSFQAAQVICPNEVVCETTTCNPCSLLQITKLQDIPRVTLIKGSTIYEDVQVLTGRCPQCKTIYLAD